MIPKLVTFDCAGTLLKNNQSAVKAILTCSARLGVRQGRTALVSAITERWSDYLEANLSKDPRLCLQCWEQIIERSLVRAGSDPSWAPTVVAEVGNLLFGADASSFPPYKDARQCLERLRDRGIQCAVVSNWDYTLHQILDRWDLTGFFDPVIASLEHGIEKPDPRIFRIALELAGVTPNDALHVGDHPIDDLEGAKSAGIRCVLLNRGRSAERTMRSLSKLEEAFFWSA